MNMKLRFVTSSNGFIAEDSSKLGKKNKKKHTNPAYQQSNFCMQKLSAAPVGPEDIDSFFFKIYEQ